MQQTFRFEPVNRGALWAKLSLTTAQVATLCDLTTRQVSYWAQKGYLPRSPSNPDRFNGDAVDMCILVKQAMDAGATLSEAARLAMRYIVDESLQHPQMGNFAPPALRDMFEKLTGVETAVHLVREMIAPQLPPVSGLAEPSAGPPHEY